MQAQCQLQGWRMHKAKRIFLLQLTHFLAAAAAAAAAAAVLQSVHTPGLLLLVAQ
jgi:hypothetical protein